MTGGGGGQSGRVDYPAYMKTWHEAALGGIPHLAGINMAWMLDQKVGHSPFATLEAYNPLSEVNDMTAAIGYFAKICQLIKGPTDWSDYIKDAVDGVDAYLYSTTIVNNVIENYAAEIDANLELVVLPRFRRGMQDINAVNTSAFVVGEAIIEAQALRDKDKFAADLALQNQKERAIAVTAGIDAMCKLIMTKLDIHRAFVQAHLEKSRLEMIAYKEQTDQDIHLTELDGRWDMEMWNYGANMLGAIGSASVRTGQQTSPLLSALGGGISGIGMLFSLAGMAGV